MYKYLLIAMISILSLSTKGQTIDNTFFLLGMKRIYQTNSKDEILSLGVRNKLIIQKFDEYLQNLKNEKFKDQVIVRDTTTKNITVFRNQVIKKYLESFYTILPDFSFIDGREYKSTIIETVKFKTDQQLNSYLAGVYYAYGSKDSIFYTFTFHQDHNNEAIAFLLSKFGGYVEETKITSGVPIIIKIKFSLFCDEKIDDEQTRNATKKLYDDSFLLKQYLEAAKKL
jgi:hypothetical protein